MQRERGIRIQAGKDVLPRCRYIVPSVFQAVKKKYVFFVCVVILCIHFNLEAFVLNRLVTIMLLCLAALMAVSCIQEPLDLKEFEDIGFGPYADQYDALLEMERIYGRTLVSVYEGTTMHLMVNEDHTVVLELSNESGTDRLEGKWSDWAVFRSRCNGWPNEGDRTMVKQEGLALVFEGDVPGNTGLVPSSFDARILFSYQLSASDVRKSEDGRYFIATPKAGAEVELAAMNNDPSPLVQPAWICID